MAFVCGPKQEINWTEVDFLMKRIVDPVCRIMSILCYLFTAIVYFVMKNLRDLVGNVITTISVCLVIIQVADIIRIFTEYAHHFSFLTAGNYNL